jgi:uncharacterized membrane protein YdjX (TVP38/TMEM64 family)
MGLMKYSPAKFFSSYFLGKIEITIVGVFLRSSVEANFSGLFSPLEMMVISIVLTITITVIMFKGDVGKILDKTFKRGKFTNKIGGEQS